MSPNASGRPLAGIHVPTITIFKDSPAQEVDIEANKKHILYLAKAGVQGVLIQGSTGEQVSLTREERIQVRALTRCHHISLSLTLNYSFQLTRATREVVEQHGFHDFTIMAGAGAQSTQEAITLAKDAASAGADYACILPPSYFAPSMTPEALESFYIEVSHLACGLKLTCPMFLLISQVADHIPIPVIIYSWPGVSSGLEITSDGITRLAKHPNIVGIKQVSNHSHFNRSSLHTYESKLTLFSNISDR